MKAKEVLKGTVDEVKDRLEDFKGDYKELLKKEKEGKDRVTAKRAIRSYMGSGNEEKEKDESEGELNIDVGVIKEKIKGGETKGMEPFVKDEFGKKYLRTGISGFDGLFDKGVPEESSVLVSGGSGTGKTIFCLHLLAFQAAHGKKCFYMSLEEPRDALIRHMKEFRLNPEKLIKAGNLKIEKFSPFKISKQIRAVTGKKREPPFPWVEDYHPDLLVVDSLTAISSVFTQEEKPYRLYLDKLFELFRKENMTSFLVSETKQEPEEFSPTGVEEFLADGVIVLYNLKSGQIRRNAIEVLKMRGENHEKRLVPMRITEDGMKVYPDQKIFGAKKGF